MVRDMEMQLKRANGEEFWSLLSAALTTIDGEPAVLAGITDITARRQAEDALHERTLELEARNQALQTALSTIRTLSGLVPICAWCGRRIQDDQGQWVRVETYLQAHGDVEFTHGMCPDCAREFSAEVGEMGSDRP